MLLLVNSTKLMDLETPPPARLRATEPRLGAEAAELMASLARLGRAELARIMDLSPALADATRAATAAWADPGTARRPALFAFTGLVYGALEPRTLTAARRRRAQERLRILSGLYGLLRPLDQVAAYRLEMGCRFRPPGAPNLPAYWREKLTAALNADLKPGEAVVSVAAQEYLKALDLPALRGPVIAPVFKERRADGGLKNAPVHAKKARGALLRFALDSGARRPADLAAFGAGGWTAEGPPPPAGPWLFTRPARD